MWSLILRLLVNTLDKYLPESIKHKVKCYFKSCCIRVQEAAHAKITDNYRDVEMLCLLLLILATLFAAVGCEEIFVWLGCFVILFSYVAEAIDFCRKLKENTIIVSIVVAMGIITLTSLSYLSFVVDQENSLPAALDYLLTTAHIDGLMKSFVFSVKIVMTLLVGGIILLGLPLFFFYLLKLSIVCISRNEILRKTFKDYFSSFFT